MEPDNRIWYAVWNMELKNDPGTIVGDFCFKRIGKDGVVEIGYGLKEPYRYHGYMSETVKAITEWVLLQDNVRIVEAETDVNNIASQQVLMRAGFIKNGKIGEEGSRFVYGGEKGMSDKIYPRTSDKQTVNLKNVVTNANIEKGVWIFTLLFQCHICNKSSGWHPRMRPRLTTSMALVWLISRWRCSKSWICLKGTPDKSDSSRWDNPENLRSLLRLVSL